MPKLGDIKTHTTKCAGTSVWHACVDCGKERWVPIRRGIPVHPRCWVCSNKRTARRGAANNMWRGGRRRVGAYIEIRMYPDDFFYAMANLSGYVREHRLIMAKHLGRCLHLWEIVHHKNGIKDDNRIENLQLVTDDRHKQITMLEMKIKQLKAQNKSLKGQLKNLIV